MSWEISDYNNFVNAMSSPFKFKEVRSQRSLGREKSCYDPKVLIGLVTPQVKEMFENNLSYETPEEWDRAFNILGGGQHRRTSKAILAIMNWDQFKYFIENLKD